MATTEEMRTCRAIGHAWYPIDASRKPKLGGYLESVRCERCFTVRNRILTRTGLIISRDYDYPFGYRDAETISGTRADHRAWLLKEMLQHALEQNEPAPVVKLRRKGVS